MQYPKDCKKVTSSVVKTVPWFKSCCNLISQARRLTGFAWSCCKICKVEYVDMGGEVEEDTTEVTSAIQELSF
jgi:hypothetical protein